MEIVLPDGRRETEVKNSIDFRDHSYDLRPWKNEIILK
jgi:hypothetical protein